MCRLVKVRKETLLPSATHDVEHTVEALIAALSQHYQIIGKLPTDLRSLDALLKGYFRLMAEEKNIVCSLDTAEEKTELEFEYAGKFEIVNCMDIDTEVRVTTKGRVTTVDSMAQEFGDAGVSLPPRVADWQGALFGEKKAERTPQKRKAEDSASSPSSCNWFASKSTVLVGEALRRKVSRNLNEASPKKEQKASGSTEK